MFEKALSQIYLLSLYNSATYECLIASQNCIHLCTCATSSTRECCLKRMRVNNLVTDTYNGNKDFI